MSGNLNDEAVLSNDHRFTSFAFDRVIRFKTSPKLERYTNIFHLCGWNDILIV